MSALEFILVWLTASFARKMESVAFFLSHVIAIAAIIIVAHWVVFR